MTRRKDSPMTYDGLLFWYCSWFDPGDDRCSVCRRPILEEEVPLILFKRVGRATHQARIHAESCAQQLIESGVLKVRPA